MTAIAARASREGLSLFLLGGGDGEAQSAARELQRENPGLDIAGTAAPRVQTAGPGLVEADKDDSELLAVINSSRADILLVGLGNPKQELWFNRNRAGLRVPVSIGVGGTFGFITGAVNRAPQWMQRLNMEWLYRITQDPARLWRRYIKGVFKLVALSAPLLWARLSEKVAFFSEQPEGPNSISWRKVWSARNESLAVLRLPQLVSQEYLDALMRQLSESDETAGMRLLDFSRVRKVELAGHQLILTLAELQRRPDNNIQLMAIPRQLKRDLAATRVLDTLQGVDGTTLAVLGGVASPGGNELTCRSYALEDGALVFLGGRVTRQGLESLGVIESLKHTARDRDCVLDLRNVTLLESSAIALLQPFFATTNAAGGRLIFSGLNKAVKQMLRMAGLGEPQNIVNDSMLLTIIGDGGPRGE